MRNDRRTIAAWCFYDWANSAFNTLVVTFVYSLYFVSSFAADPGRGTALWSRGITLSAIIIAVLAPLAGSLADQGGRRKYLIGCTVVTCLFTAALTFVRPSQAGSVVTALAIFVIANVAFEIGLVFYNAILPGIVSENRIGRVSGYGWGLGYAGGLACLGFALPFVMLDPPPFGVSTTEEFNVRATNLLVAGWFLLFSLPLFVFVRDPPGTRSRVDVRAALTGLAQTVTHLRRYREVVRLLVARLFYNDGLVTIYSFGGIYAQGTFGFTIPEAMVLAIYLNIVAGLGAWIFGFVDDCLGGKWTIMISVVCLAAATLLAALAPDRFWFWVASIVVGFFLGPNQSASRSLMGRFVPKQHESEFYGFFAFSGKATMFMGPLLFGVLSDVYSQRVGVASVLLFFIVGGVLLLRVDEAAGIQAVARQSSE